MKYADLHTHSYYSDGINSPQEIIKLAEKNNVSAVSVTDHDTVEGLEPLFKINTSVEIIPGIELTAEIDNIEVHILGYFIDWQDIQLRKKLEEIKQIRRDRVFKFKEKLATLGVEIDANEIIKSAGCGTVGRLHIAKELLNKKYVSSIQEAFVRYIGDRAPGYISSFRLSPDKAIKLLKDNGGVPVLAHPYSIAKQGIIYEIINAGIMGLEVYYPEHNPSCVKYYKEMAQKYNLVITGGSDFHGEIKEGISLGMMKVSYEVVQNLKDAKKKV